MSAHVESLSRISFTLNFRLNSSSSSTQIAKWSIVSAANREKKYHKNTHPKANKQNTLLHTHTHTRDTKRSMRKLFFLHEKKYRQTTKMYGKNTQNTPHHAHTIFLLYFSVKFFGRSLSQLWISSFYPQKYTKQHFRNLFSVILLSIICFFFFPFLLWLCIMNFSLFFLIFILIECC